MEFVTYTGNSTSSSSPLQSHKISPFLSVLSGYMKYKNKHKQFLRFWWTDGLTNKRPADKTDVQQR